MLTMHSVKGLVFDAVAIVEMQDGKVPDYRWTTDEDKRKHDDFCK